jgi:hypothetical protein
MLAVSVNGIASIHSKIFLLYILINDYQPIINLNYERRWGIMFKHFNKFNRNFVRQNETCMYCQKEFHNVDLTLSNRKELFVRCETPGCKGYTIAERKRSATGVLNRYAVCI